MVIRRPLLGFLLTATVAGCGPSEPAPSEAAPVQSVLAPHELLVRASLDIRGIRPTASELRTVLDNPDAVGDLVATFVEHPGFGERLKSMFAPAFRTRIDVYPYYNDVPGFSEAVGEEPLDLLRTIVEADRPYSDLVLADFTVVRPELLDYWPLDTIDGVVTPEGTVAARYTDGRPHVGVLTTNAMWWRHTSTLENANRGRANALSEGLLCESYLDRPIDFPPEIDLSDSDTIRQAIREEQACTACHATLDPLASYFWGFLDDNPSAAGWNTYAPADERRWVANTGQPPGYYGTPGDTLYDLGVHMASDERFVMCGVERTYRGMLGRDLGLSEDGALAEHRDAFVASGLNVKALVQSITTDPRYQGRAETPAYGGQPAAVELKTITPDQLSSELEVLTGYRMTILDRDALRLDGGLRSVAGGSDAGTATLPSTGLYLVHRRLAEAAAVAMVDDVVDGGTLADALPVYDQAPTGEQLAELVLRTSSQVIAPDGPEVEALIALWQDAERLSDAPTAWKGVLTALLADPARLVY